jgi:hypothetical protein
VTDRSVDDSSKGSTSIRDDDAFTAAWRRLGDELSSVTAEALAAREQTYPVLRGQLAPHGLASRADRPTTFPTNGWAI